ncbi:MAG TPA: Dabb family protein [Mycobacterium sp.]|jgi:hypothetical protein
MFSVTRLIHTRPAADRDTLTSELRAVVAGVEHTLVEPTLPGVRNGGDILVHLRFDDRMQWSGISHELDVLLAQREIGHVDGADYSGAPQLTGHERPSAVYRSLLLRVMPGVDDMTVMRFEDDLRLLPQYVPSITAWQLSRVESAVGAAPWTHVFEQEFCSLEALTGPYLMHPVHWAYVDRWFDPECPEVIVRERVCHSFCRCDRRVIV